MTDEDIEEIRAVLAVMQDFHDRIDVMLSNRPMNAGTEMLTAATKELKEEIKDAHRTGKIHGQKMPTVGPARFLAVAIREASTAFRMRADTAPSKAEWRQTLDELRASFETCIRHIRTECPEA